MPGTPGRCLRLHPENDRDRPVHGPDGPGHEPAALRQRQPGVRHRGQRLRPPGKEGAPAAAPCLAERHHDPYACAGVLAEPEIFFSIIQKKVVSPNDFASTGQLSASLLAFIDRHNKTARPFSWKFTAADLTGMLKRISAREEPAQEPATLPQAA